LRPLEFLKEQIIPKGHKKKGKLLITGVEQNIDK
jgi:hypothetical protein